MRVPFAVPRVENLVDYHDLEFSNGVLQDEVRQLAEEVRRELHPYLIRPVPELVQEEAYTVFCIQSPFTTVNDASRGNLESVRKVIEASLPQGMPQVRQDLTQLSNLWANGAIFEVASADGEWLFRSARFLSPELALPAIPPAGVSSPPVPCAYPARAPD